MNIKKRFCIIFAFILMQTVYAEDKILNIYTWAGFLPPSVIRLFERETGIRVNQSTYVSNEVLYAKLKANPDAGYDIAIPSSYFISRMVKQGLLQKVDKHKLSHFKNIDTLFLRQEYDLENEYSIPYLWHSTGMVVNTKYHSPTRINAWRDLWASQYKEQLLLLDDPREIFSMALLTLGYSINDEDPEHIKEAFLYLKSLMNNVKLFNLDAQRSIYLDEDITIGMGWNGDIYLARQENLNLRFIYPKEGYMVSLDCIVIPHGAKHVEYAYRFIDFVLRPEIAKQISLDTGFSTPNWAAKEQLPLKIQEDTLLYPDKITSRRGHILSDIDKAAPLYEKYFERLKLEQ